MVRKKRGFAIDEDSDHPVHERYAKEGKRKDVWVDDDEDEGYFEDESDEEE